MAELIEALTSRTLKHMTRAAPPDRNPIVTHRLIVNVQHTSEKRVKFLYFSEYIIILNFLQLFIELQNQRLDSNLLCKHGLPELKTLQLSFLGKCRAGCTY